MHTKIVRGLQTVAASLCLTAAPGLARAGGLDHIRIVVVDAQTHLPIPEAQVTVEDLNGGHLTRRIAAGPCSPSFNTHRWTLETGLSLDSPTLIMIPIGTSVALIGQAQPLNSGAQAANPGVQPGASAQSAAGAAQQPPVTEIHIRIRADRLQTTKSGPTTAATTIGGAEIARKVGGSENLNKALQGNSGVAADSAGQIHVRGEHADISYVVDGVGLPDTLSGRQGSVVVPSTIRSLEFITGGFAPEFGQQTAAILNIETVPGAAHSHSNVSVEAGSFDTTNGDFTTAGPLGKYASYVLDLSATRTRNAVEPQQPDDQTAHNAGSDLNEFGKFRFATSHRDTLSLTLSRSPGTLQIGNRTGLPSSFASAGQGYGFQGLRNRNGARPDVTSDNQSALGADNLTLLSQQAAGQDITQREVSEFGTFSWRRELSSHDTGLFAVTLLHSGQDVHNNNPAVDLLNLPVDNSIEYNPTATRNVHHVQITSSLASKIGAHQLKAGIQLDDQNGNETYNLVPASQLALNALAAFSPALAPAGAVQTDAQGNPVTDLNGNPVFTPTAGTVPTLQVHRSGFYRAAYVQDTWRASRKFVVNYGLRADWYKQGQNLGQATVDVSAISPRLNFSYAPDPKTAVRWSYNRLFNTPPLAQGAVVGQPIQPEILDQYDLSAERRIGPGQSLHLAYYIKDMRNQVDTGLLIPGSQIGIYSAVNLQYGGVHGLEFSYEIVPPNGRTYGFDASFNYSYSIARPNGKDNTGADVPDFNDHDQRNTVSLDVGYTWKSGALASFTINHGSGLASSPIPPSTRRVPRTQIDLRFGTGPRLFHGRGGIGLSVENLLDDRTVINFQSAFSGTRFQQARRILVNANLSF
jgi:outer membrane receptor protein involved in Fe transport